MPKELRHQLLDNGYTPLPNLDKRCMLPKWPTVEVTHETIDQWARRNKRFDATGIRVQDGLAVIDFDIDVDEATMNLIVQEIEKIQGLEELSMQALVRFGKGFKEAWFVRTSESFSRIFSRNWIAPGDGEDAETHMVECFGGLAPRQFGAFGAHSRDDDGNVLLSYSWDGPSPADVPQRQLPELTKAQFFAVVDAVSRVLERRGFTVVERSQSGEADAVRVYDLTEDMVFNMDDGRTLTLPELREEAKAEEGLRCSARWLDGPGAVNTTRCIVGTTRYGQLTIWDSASCTTHLEASNQPRNYELDLDRVAERLKEIDVKRRHKISSGDDAITAAMKLLETHAFCPNQQNGVVPIWATSLDEGITMSSFRTMMLPNCSEDVGPRGGRVVINPVDIWASSERRTTVAGLRMRPDQPRPTYDDEGKVWVNIYAPPHLPTEGGDAEPGIAFMEQLIPEPEERHYFLQWLAHKYRRPDIPGPAIVMVARQQGTGRGTLSALLARMFGPKYVRNLPFHIFAGRSYQSQYNDWGAEALLAIVSESSEAQGGSLFHAKRDTYEHLKELVEPRPVEKMFVMKGSRSFNAISFTSYIIATNNMDALPIPPEDRRFAVLANGEPRDPAYWERLNDWMDVPENVAAFARWLREYDLTGYSPFAAPLVTEAKLGMADAARSDIDRALDDVAANLQTDVFVIEQLIAGMRQAARLYGYDYPDKWQPVAKRAAQSRFWRVGERDGLNWHPQIEGRRYAVYARSKEAARAWTKADPQRLRAEVLKNGSPGETELPGNVLQGLFKKGETT